jgi:phosphatidylethanolamine/phosphatidyl-N-methylethanolamine N-methyltransferase
LTRDEIIEEYYSKYFTALCNTGAQGWGSQRFHKNIEKRWKNKKPQFVLEVGAGSGEHFVHLQDINPDLLQQYIALDIRANSDLPATSFAKGLIPIKWVSASVQDIPFADSYFDRAVSTCLFHHLENPHQGFLELRRVVADKGEISIGMPTDPGIANQILKTLYTYRKAKKLGVENPRFIYALEHRNGLVGLLTIVREVFRDDEISFTYWPFRIRNRHVNLSVNINIVVSKKRLPSV